MMFNGIFHIREPVNEPCLQYAPGSAERAELKAKLNEMLNQQVDVPMIIGGEEVRNGKLADIRCPHHHQHILGRCHQANALFVSRAIDAPIIRCSVMGMTGDGEDFGSPIIRGGLAG